MEIKQPKTQKDLDHLRCWLGERLLLVSLVVPLCVLFLSFLSYLLLEGCVDLSKYTNMLSVLPMELKNVKTVLYSFAYSFIIINTGFILFIILTIPLLFCHYTKMCMISEIKSPQKSIVWSGIRDFTILDNSDIKYRLRRRNILKFWKTKFPKTMMFAAFLFWIIITSIVLCVTQFIAGKATVMMWLNLPVIALMISVLRLITNNDLFLLRFYISTYKKILPDTEEDADDESDDEDDIFCEAEGGESWSCSGRGGDGESWDVNDTEYAFAAPSVTNLCCGDNALGDNANDIVVGIDDVDTEDNRFGGDLNFDCGSDSE
jgi:hypothetical protein